MMGVFGLVFFFCFRCYAGLCSFSVCCSFVSSFWDGATRTIHAPDWRHVDRSAYGVPCSVSLAADSPE
uniref:Putative secreted protein n=1 Tax=Anopheles darlingi TaxID=43151 RepID=A0A2M4DGD8_ANODA